MSLSQHTVLPILGLLDLFHLKFISDLFANLLFVTMPSRRKLPSVSNSINVKNSLTGTERANLVIQKDLDFWLPLTRPHLNPDVPGVDTLQQLLTLPKAHMGHILSNLLTVYRQNRNPGGKRYTNASLLVKVEAMQRVIRKFCRRSVKQVSLKQFNHLGFIPFYRGINDVKENTPEFLGDLLPNFISGGFMKSLGDL